MSSALLSTIAALTSGETLTIVVTITTAIMAALVALWIYFEGKREADRNERRQARHNELTGKIDHLKEVVETKHVALDAKFDSRMDSLSRRVDEQGNIIRTYGSKIDHFDRTVHQMDKRVAVLEEARRQQDQHNDKRRAAEKASA